MEKITAIRLFKNEGEYVVTRRDANTGKTFKTYANRLNDREKAWAKSSKYFFEDATCACWMN